MAVTVLDSNNLDAILADAGVEVERPTEQPSGDEKPVEKPVEAHDEDHDEDDNGLTDEERTTLTAKMQKAIGKKHRMLKEAEEFAAAQYSERKLAEQRAANLEEELAKLRTKSAPPQEAPTAPEKPQRQNFASEAEYIDAMIQFGVDQRLAEKAESDRKAAEEAARDKVMESAKGRISRAMEIVPDWQDVVSSVDAVVPPAIAGYMQKSEMIAELGYHLAKNPEILVSLAKLPPDEQLVKIGRIESNLAPFEPKAAQNDAKSSSKDSDGSPPRKDTDIDLSKPRGKAAPVITPLEGAGSAGHAKDSADMNIREAIEDYSKRRRVNLGMRKRH